MRLQDPFRNLLLLACALTMFSLVAEVAVAASPSDVAAQRCECKCAGRVMVLGDADQGSCRARNGAPCLTPTGDRAQLGECDFLFVSPGPTAVISTPLDAATTAEICDGTETWADCEDRLLKATAIDEEDLKEEVADDLRNLLLGASSPNASVTPDFIQRLLVALDIPGLTEENGLLSFRYNTPDEIFGFEAKANEAVLFDKLRDALPASDQESRSEQLSKAIEVFDDVSLNVSINVKPANTRLASGKLRAAAEELLVIEVAARNEELDSAEDTVRRTFRRHLNDRGLSLESLVGDAGEERAVPEGILEKYVEAAAASDEAFLENLEGSGFFSLADLAANQPQLSVTAQRRVKDDLVGPDTWTAALTWQMGLGANLNTLKKKCPIADPACYSGFLKSVGEAVQRKWRLSFEAAYSETDAYVSPIADAILHLDKNESLTAKATLGGVLRYEVVEGKTVEQSSFAFEGSYEDVTGDAERQNRLVATATLTQRMNADFSAEISVVWANKPEYRGDVDEEWSTTAGLRYKLNGKAK